MKPFWKFQRSYLTIYSITISTCKFYYFVVLMTIFSHCPQTVESRFNTKTDQKEVICLRHFLDADYRHFPHNTDNMCKGRGG